MKARFAFSVVLALASVAGAVADPVAFNGIKNATGQYWGYRWPIWNGQVFTSFGDPASAPQGDYWEAWTSGDWWADGTAPSADKEYVVGGGRGIVAAHTTAGGTFDFAGKKLILGNWNSSAPTEQRDINSGRYSFGTQDSGWLSSYTATLNLANDGLEVRYGGFLGRGTSGSTVTINGKVDVTAKEAFPAWFFMSYVAMTWVFNDAVSSPVGSKIDSIVLGGGQNTYTTLKFLGGMSDFYGTLNLSNYTHATFADGTVIPGKLMVGKNSYIRTNKSGYLGSLRVGDLVLDGSTSSLYVGAKGDDHTTYTVDNGVTVSGSTKPVVKFDYGNAGICGYMDDIWAIHVTNGTARCLKLFDVPADDPSPLEAFTWKNLCSDVSPNFDWQVIWNEHGAQRIERIEGDRRCVYLDVPKMTYALTGGDVFSDGNADKWYGGKAGENLSSDTCYFISNSTVVNAPKTSNYTFPGLRLVVPYSAAMVVYGNTTFDDLHLGSGAKYLYNSTSRNIPSMTHRGKITIFNNLVNGKSFDGTYGEALSLGFDPAPVSIEADIVGDAAVYIKETPVSWDYAKHSACAMLLGDNSKFSGRLMVKNDGWADGYKTYLAVTNAAGLGGGAPLTGTDRAIQLRDGGGLMALASMTLDDAARTVYVGTNAYISVSNSADVLTLGPTLTIAGDGPVTKEGAGTLALSVKPTVVSTPSLTVAEGALMPKATDALEGLAVTVADGAALAIDGDSTDATYAATGLDLAKASVTFAGAKKVVVRKAIDFKSAYKSQEVVLASGTAEAVAAFADGLSVVFSDGTREKRAGVFIRATADGQQAVARLSGKGFALFIR